MDGIRNVTSTSWAHEYNNKAIVYQQEFVAAENDCFDVSNSTENFAKSKQDWTSMVTRMRADYMGAGIYKQVLDGNKLLQLFEKYI